MNNFILWKNVDNSILILHGPPHFQNIDILLKCSHTLLHFVIGSTLSPMSSCKKIGSMTERILLSHLASEWLYLRQKQYTAPWCHAILSGSCRIQPDLITYTETNPPDQEYWRWTWIKVIRKLKPCNYYMISFYLFLTDLGQKVIEQSLLILCIITLFISS